jgi:uncharacterized protein
MVLTVGSFILLFSIAIIISFLAAMVGIGGGVFMVPILVAFFGLSVPEARNISLFCMIFVTISATIGYSRYKCIDWKLGLVYESFAIPGVLVGKLIADLIDLYYPDVLKVIVVGALWTFATLILVQKHHKQDELIGGTVVTSFLDDANEIKLSRGKKWLTTFFASFFGGFVAGSVGMGGGTVKSTTMFLLGMTPLIAVATAEFSMMFTNTFGFISSAVFPLIPWNFPGFGTNSSPILWDYILPMGIASLIGGFLGTILSRRLKGSILKKLLASISILVGIPIILQVLGIWSISP